MFSFCSVLNKVYFAVLGESNSPVHAVTVPNPHFQIPSLLSKILVKCATKGWGKVGMMLPSDT